MRTAIVTFTSLILAVAALSPASASGDASGTALPIKATFSNTTVLDLATLTFHYEGTVLDSHLGKSTFEGEGSIVPTSFTTFNQSDSGVVTAANGDELFGTNAETGTALPRGLVFGGAEETLVQTITGGTGRFANATGTLTGRFKSVFVSLAWPFVTYGVHGSSEGSISY